jgi:hypothetical protein
MGSALSRTFCIALLIEINSQPFRPNSNNYDVAWFMRKGSPHVGLPREDRTTARPLSMDEQMKLIAVAIASENQGVKDLIARLAVPQPH